MEKHSGTDAEWCLSFVAIVQPLRNSEVRGQCILFLPILPLMICGTMHTTRRLSIPPSFPVNGF